MQTYSVSFYDAEAMRCVGAMHDGSVFIGHHVKGGEAEEHAFAVVRAREKRLDVVLVDAIYRETLAISGEMPTHFVLGCDFEVIGTRAFADDARFYVGFSKKKGLRLISGPGLAAVRRIEDFAFFACSALRLGCNWATFPVLEEVGDHAFRGCAFVHDAWLPLSVQRVGSHAFCRTGVTRVSLPTHCDTRCAAFSECIDLNYVVYVDDVQRAASERRIVIGAFTFCTTPMLWSVEMPPGAVLDRVGMSAFQSSGLTGYFAVPDLKSCDKCVFAMAGKLRLLQIDEPLMDNDICMKIAKKTARLEGFTSGVDHFPDNISLIYDANEPRMKQDDRYRDFLEKECFGPTAKHIAKPAMLGGVAMHPTWTRAIHSLFEEQPIDMAVRATMLSLQRIEQSSEDGSDGLPALPMELWTYVLEFVQLPEFGNRRRCRACNCRLEGGGCSRCGGGAFV